MKIHFLYSILVACSVMVPRSAAGGDLEKPFRVEANKQPIDTEIGHAAPFVGDFDGDGVPDLLVGQFGGGKLRIFRNEGTAAAPKFVRSAWFQCAGALGTVPAS